MRIRGFSLFLGVFSQVVVFILRVQLRALYWSLSDTICLREWQASEPPFLPTHNTGIIIHITAHCVLCALLRMCFCVFRLRVEKTVRSTRMSVQLKYSYNYTRITTKITNLYNMLLLNMLIVHQLFQRIFRCLCNKAVY